MYDLLLILPLMEHCIGLDYKKPYKRHNKLFYKPYRNYFSSFEDDKVWQSLCVDGFAEHDKPKIICDASSCNYWLTRKGLDFLGEIIGVHIYDK